MVMLSTRIPAQALKRQIASGIDIIIHLGRLRDKSRHVLEIVEVVESDASDIVTRPLFRFVESGSVCGRIEGRLMKEQDVLNTQKIINAGLYNKYCGKDDNG